MSGKTKQTTTNSQYSPAQAALSGKTYTPVSVDRIKELENPHTSAVIDATIKRNNQNRQMSLNEIGDQAARAGAFGGSRHGVAEGVARGQFDLNDQQTVAGLNAAGFSQAMQTAVAENDAVQKYPLAIQALLASMATQNSTTKAPTDWGAILQGLGSAASGAAMMSDRRLKRDIRPLGEHKGRQWYRYKYLWSDVDHVGVMAQENPDIAFDVGGFLAVDYSGIV